MADSEVVAAYRLNAANCTDLANEDPDHRLALLVMAQAWLRLADITEKLGEAVQDIPIMQSSVEQS